jgi:hypothetical protein
MSRILLVYLVFYFALVIAATLVLFSSGVLGHLPLPWVIAALLLALGLGVMLALLSRSHRRSVS